MATEDIPFRGKAAVVEPYVAVIDSTPIEYCIECLDEIVRKIAPYTNAGRLITVHQNVNAEIKLISMSAELPFILLSFAVSCI